MELVLELKESLTAKKAERIIALLLVLVLTAGAVGILYERVVFQERNTGELSKVEVEKNIHDTTPLIVETTTKVYEESEIVTKEIETMKTGTIETETMEAEIVEEVETEPVPEAESAVKTETLNEVITEAAGITVPEIVTPDINDTMVSDKTDSTTIEVEKVPAADVFEDEGEKVPVITPSEDVDDVLTEEVPKEETPGDEVEIISPFLIDEAGMIYGFLPEYADLSSGYLELPSEGCIGIRKGAFSDSANLIIEISVPAGITEIEDGALTEITSLEWITVQSGNSKYKTVDGILYDSTASVLCAYPPARVGVYGIPAGVTSIEENAFLNTLLFMIDIRACSLSENCLLNISPSCSIIR